MDISPVPDDVLMSLRSGSGDAQVDPELIQSVTDVLQAQERLILNLRKKECSQNLIQTSSDVLTTMSCMKASMEGKEIELTAPKLNEQALQRLRALTLMHLHRTLTPIVIQEFQDCIHKAFEGTVCKVIFARLCWCPWYITTQPELGQQAKHNSLFMVYTTPDHYVFSPVNPHSKEKTEVIDLDWLYAVEVHHFARYLIKAKARMVESVFSGLSSQIITEHQWTALLKQLDTKILIDQSQFLEMCRGQAVGGLAKKSKVSGKMKLKADVTLYQFCESFRLLQYAVSTINQFNLQVENLELDQLSGTAKEAQKLLTDIYQHEGDGRTKEDLFDLLMTMKGEVDLLLKNFKHKRSNAVEEQVGMWMKLMRVGDRSPKAETGLLPDQREELLELMKKVGGPVATMDPENIVMVVRAGSYLYNLSTPESDVDYLVVYVNPTENFLSKVGAPRENIENRGPSKVIEYGAYEIRLFAEMILKGSVVISEIVYVGQAEYSSTAWKALCTKSQLFVTEHVILQYMGLIKNNMHNIESRKFEGEPREKKLFYQIFHKLWTLEFLAEGKVPPVKCSDEIQDFIMSVRRGPLEEDLHRDKLYYMANDKLQSLKGRLSNRRQRSPEHADLQYLTEWILTVRGLI